MGQGNICTFLDGEGLYYVSADRLNQYLNKKGELKAQQELDELGERYDYDYDHDVKWRYDEGATLCDLKALKNDLKAHLESEYPNVFAPCDNWGRTPFHANWHYFLESDEYTIAMADNTWSYALGVLRNDDADDSVYEDDNVLEKGAKYLEVIKRFLVLGYGEAIAYGGAWSSGERYTKEDITEAKPEDKPEVDE